MVKFVLEDDDSVVPTPEFSKKKPDRPREIIETDMNHTRICPECGKEGVIVELVDMCIGCVNDVSGNDNQPEKKKTTITMTEEITEIEEIEEEIVDIKDIVAIYKKQFPKKKPVYQRGGESVESKHFQAWKKKYESELETVKDIVEMVEKDELSEDIIQFLDKFCISAIEAKKYKGSIKTGKGINSEFLKWYLNNTNKSLTKHIDYKKMGVKNQHIVKEFLEIEDNNNQKDTEKDLETTKSKPVIKKSSKTLDKLDDHRRELMKNYISGLKDNGKEFDFTVLKDTTVEIFKKDLQDIPQKDLQMCFYMVMSQVEFLYELMSNNMTLRMDKLPTDGQQEAIEQIKFMLGK